MLGCKFEYHQYIKASKYELIDTCWDVNDITLVVFDEAISELIDTCWDVNAADCAASAALKAEN